MPKLSNPTIADGVDLIFTNPLANDPGPRTRVLHEILTLIKDTTSELKIAVAYFNHPAIARALVERSREQRKTLLLLNTSDLVRPLAAGESEVVISRALLDVIDRGCQVIPRALGVRARGAYQNMHHKFAVSADRVIFGSLNWTTAALEQNFECIALSDDPQIVMRFQQEFSALWSQAEEIYTSDGVIRCITCPQCRSSWGVDFESWGPSCLQCGHRFKVG